MKIKYIITIILLGFILENLGVHFKLMHLMGAPEIYTAATVLKTLGYVLAIWKVLTTKDFDSIFNK